MPNLELSPIETLEIERQLPKQSPQINVQKPYSTFTSSESLQRQDSSSIESMQSIGDVLESQPNEDPRALVIPTQQRRPTLMMATLESLLGQVVKNKLNLVQEEEPIFNEQIQLATCKQPLIIYDRENPVEAVDTFCNYNEVPEFQKQEIIA